MNGKRVLLIVGGGIAAYKSLELPRLLRKAGVGVSPILTAAGARFVTPLSLSALAESQTRTDLFSLDDEAEMGHIELSRSADLVVVAPATADLMAKAAAGLADDLASTALLATDKPVLMAPAMNVRMWLHAATQRNLAVLKADGVAIVGPDEGAMACGEFGPGRMAEPQRIFDAIQAALDPAARPLAEEYRNLPHGTWPAHRRASARRDLPGNDISDRMAGLTTGKPGREHRVRPLDEPRHGQRPSREQDGDHRFAKRLGAIDDAEREPTLLPGQVETCAAGSLAAHRSGFAHT